MQTITDGLIIALKYLSKFQSSGRKRNRDSNTRLASYSIIIGVIEASPVINSAGINTTCRQPCTLITTSQRRTHFRALAQALDHLQLYRNRKLRYSRFISHGVSGVFDVKMQERVIFAQLSQSSSMVAQVGAQPLQERSAATWEAVDAALPSSGPSLKAKEFHYANQGSSTRKLDRTGRARRKERNFT